jgi:Ca2+-binding EF-hand superfamily protein
MWRVAVLVSALTVVPSLAAAQQPCTTDTRQVIEQAYRQVLERSADAGASVWVDRLNNRTTVREIMRGLAKSPEHSQRFGNQARENVVVDVYRHLLNRGPDPDGLKNAVNLVSRRGVQPLIDQIVDSQEYRQQFGDWTVPGSSVRFCANGEQPGQQSSIAPGSGNRGNGMRFRRMDTNNDGVIARSEWRGNPRTFDTYDWNNDGRLSGDEVSVIARRRGNRTGEDGEVALDDRFDYLDINGNGYVDTNEWDGGQYAFDRLDTNDDRRLTRGEFNSANNGNASNFTAIDMNNDGRIRLDEWPWSHTSFDRQDTNGDGVISRGEYRGAPAVTR